MKIKKRNQSSDTSDAGTVGNLNLLSRREVAEYLGVCQHTIRRFELRGIPRGVRINRRIVRYKPEDVALLVRQAAA